MFIFVNGMYFIMPLAAGFRKCPRGLPAAMFIFANGMYFIMQIFRKELHSSVSYGMIRTENLKKV